MNQEYSDSKTHWIFAVLLGIAGLLILLVFVNLKSKADDSNTLNSNLSVSSTAPSLANLKVCLDNSSNHASAGACGTPLSDGGTITLTETDASGGATGGTDIYFTGTLYASSTISEWYSEGADRFVYYFASTTAGLTDGSCTPTTGLNGGTASKGCYSMQMDTSGLDCNFSDSSQSSSIATSETFSCKIHMKYNATPVSTWKLAIRLRSASYATTGSVFTTDSNAYQVASLNAVVLDASSITFQKSGGSVQLESESDAKTVVVYNTGNTTSDYRISASSTGSGTPNYAMACSVGNIPTYRLRYSTASSGFTYFSASSVPSTTPSGSSGAGNIASATATAANSVPSSSLYLKLKPNLGISGSCSGYMIFVGTTGLS